VCREAFFTPSWQDSVVFENSAACVYVETSWPASACREETRPVTLFWFLRESELGRHFEHKLEAKLAGSVGLPADARQTNFTESLILAQDERWRRA
jgi:hypothetical protein